MIVERFQVVVKDQKSQRSYRSRLSSTRLAFTSLTFSHQKVPLPTPGRSGSLHNLNLRYLQVCWGQGWQRWHLESGVVLDTSTAGVHLSPTCATKCHKVPPATTARQRFCRWLSEECVRVTSLRSPGHRTSYPLWTADCFCVFCLLLHLFALCLLFKLLLDNRVTPDNCLFCCLADQVETGSAVTWKYPSCVLKAAQTPLFR